MSGISRLWCIWEPLREVVKNAHSRDPPQRLGFSKLGAGPRDLNSNKKLVYRSHFENDHKMLTYGHKSPVMEKLRLTKRRPSFRAEIPSVIGIPGDENVPFPPSLGFEGLLSISQWDLRKQSQAKTAFFFFLPDVVLRWEVAWEDRKQGGEGTWYERSRGKGSQDYWPLTVYETGMSVRTSKCLISAAL